MFYERGGMLLVMSLFGPLFRYELTRLARRGLQPKLRAAFAGLLLVALLLAYLAAFPGTSPYQILTHIDEPLTVQATSRFGERFLVAFLFIQAAIVMLVTPVIAAGALGEDKERGALELLLTTALSPLEIVLGKLAARFVFVGSLLFTGLPVVTLIIFFGGVDIGQLVAGYAVAALTILSLSAIAVHWSIVEDTLGSATVRAYIYALCFSLIGIIGIDGKYPALLSPFATTWALLHGWSILPNPTNPDVLAFVGIYAAVHLLMAAMFIALAARGLRQRPVRAKRSRPEGVWDMPSEYSRSLAASRGNSQRNRFVPHIADDAPFSWKERYFGGFLSASRSLSASPGCVLLLFGALAFFAFWFPRHCAVPGFLLVLVIVGLGTASSVARERQRGTLDSLLMLPGQRSDILWPKLEAGLVSGRWAAISMFAFLLLGVPTGQVGGQACIAVPILLVGWMVAAAGFGLWMSVRCLTVQRAVIYWFVGVLLLAVIPPLVAPLVGQCFEKAPTAKSAMAVCEAFSPPVAIWNATMQWDDKNYIPASLGACIAAVLAGFAGAFFLSLAARRLESNEN